MNAKLYFKRDVLKNGVTTELLEQMIELIDFQNTTDAYEDGTEIEYDDFEFRIENLGDIIITKIK